LTAGSGAVAPLARWYTDLRAATAKALLTAESEAIRALADALPRKLTVRPRLSARASKTLKGS
jgi:hypothetical protein